MPDPKLTDQLDAFRTWKQNRSRLLTRLQPWLKQQDLLTTEARNRFETTSLGVQRMSRPLPMGRAFAGMGDSLFHAGQD